MGTYLVTGAAGFIASKVCEKLLASGHIVIGIDNLNDYYDVRLKDYRLGMLLRSELWRSSDDASASVFHSGREYACGNFLFKRIDIEDLGELTALFQAFKFDAIFNLAARAGVRASMENPYIFLSTNTEGSLNILECQRRFGVQKQVLASTSSLYAGCPMPFTEDQPVNTPLSPYAAAKKAAELMAYSYHRLYELDISVLRYFTVFGPAGRPDMAPFRFIKWIDEQSPLHLFGDGSQSRDFTYVDDIAEGTVLARKLCGYEIMNLGGGRSPLSLRDIIRMIEVSLGKRAIVVEKPFHIADVKETCAAIEKAKAILGWEPRTAPDAGFTAAIRWYQENRDWVSKLRV